MAAPVVVVVTRDTTRTGVAAKGGGKRTSFSRPILVGVVPVAAMEDENQKGEKKDVDSSQKDTLSVKVSSQPVTHAMSERTHGRNNTEKDYICKGEISLGEGKESFSLTSKERRDIGREMNEDFFFGTIWKRIRMRE